MDGFDSFPPRGIFGRSFSDSAVTHKTAGWKNEAKQTEN